MPSHWNRWLKSATTGKVRAAGRRNRHTFAFETLEDRSLPTIVFTPQFGPDTLQSSAPFNSSDNGVMSSATLYLILWGPDWSQTPTGTQSDANTVINEAKAVVNSTAPTVLKQYGSDGKASFGGFYIDNSAVPAGFGVATGSGFVDNATFASYTEAENEITRAINGGHLPGPAGNPKLASAPIYAIVTDPNDSFDGFGNSSNGGVNRNGVVTSGTFNGNNINMIGVGTGSDSSFQGFGPVFSHELLEKMSEPGGRPGDPPPAGYGVVVSPPANIPPFIMDTPGDPVTAQDNWDQIADFEPEQSFTLGNGNTGFGYIYRVGGTGGVEVQAVYSDADKAFVVEDGNSAVFTLTPNWTIDSSDPNSDSFTGTYDLTINGDQLANKNDAVTIARDSAGGIQVTLDGQVANFDPGTSTTIGTAIRSIKVNGLTGSNTLTLDFTNGNFLSVMNPNGDTLANGLISYDGGLGGTNTLVLKGGTFLAEVDTATGAGSGTISLAGSGVQYAGLSRIIDTTAATTLTINGTGAAGGTIRVVNDPNGTENGSASDEVAGSGFTTVDFANKTNLQVQAAATLAGAGPDAFTLNVSGPAATLTTLTLSGGTAGSSSFNVQATAAQFSTQINGGGASDTFTVSSDATTGVPPAGTLAGILGAVSLTGGSGSANRLIVSDIGNTATADTVRVTNNSIVFAGGATAAISYSAPGGSFTHPGFGDGILIQGADTGGGPANVYNVASTPAGSTVELDGGTGPDVFTVSSDAPGVAGNLDGIGGPLTINGGGGGNTLTLSDASATTAAADVRLTPTAVTGLAGSAHDQPIDYSGIATLVVHGAAKAGNGYTVASPAAALTLDTNGPGDQVFVRSLTQPAAVNTTAGTDAVTVGNTAHSLGDIGVPLTVNGAGNDSLTADDSGATGPQGYTLTATTLSRTLAAAITYGGIKTMTVLGGTGPNTYQIGATGASGSTTVDDGPGTSAFTIEGDALTGADTFNGNGGGDAFTLNAGTGVSGTALTISGGGGPAALAVNGGAADDTITAQVTDSTGGGALLGLGQEVDYVTIQKLALDGGSGANSLAWVDDTKTGYGTALAPDTGVIVRPLGAASGDVRIGLAGTVFPVVAFANINGAFSVNGDGTGSGPKDTVTVLGPSTTGLQSAFGELTSANGSNKVTVTDQLVTIDNAALGAMRSVALAPTAGQPSFATLLVRTGNQPPPVGDTVTATPSNRLNILVDGMGPAGGRPGDSLTVTVVGSRVVKAVTDPALGPPHSAIVQVSDGASLGFLHFEGVAGTAVEVIGSGGGTATASEVIVNDPTTGKPRFAPIVPFPGFTGGLSVATADVTGDGIPDVIVGAGAGGGPRVSVYNGIDGSLVATFFAYDSSFRDGVNVAAADVNGDGYADIVAGAGPGGAPHVKVFSGADFSLLSSFFAYDSSFRDGVNVAAGYTTASGYANIVTGAGTGGAPHVKVFAGPTGALVQSFFAFDSRFRGGVYVATGDLTGNHLADIIVGAGPGDQPKIRAFSPVDGSVLADFWVNNPFAPNAVPQIPQANGIRVGAADLTGDGVADILAAGGPGSRPILYGYKLAARDPGTNQVTPVPLTQVAEQTEFGPGYAWGIFVGGSN